MTSLHFPPTAWLVPPDDERSRRRRSDGGLTSTSASTSAINSTSASGRRNMSPRPRRRSGVVVSGPAEELVRSTSYEEELELRLEHVRLRAVDAERRLAAERLRRRQAMQRMSELEQQHVELVARLATEAERKSERLRARYDQVKNLGLA
jgi:hypothetical protein